MSPESCAFGVGVPIERTAFERSRAAGATFAQQFAGGWPQYLALFAHDCRSALSTFQQLGVRVVCEMRLIDLPALFEAHAAVVLFSHWADDAVEFADGLVPGARVVDAVPVSFTGVFDLCVCYPMSLVNRLNELRPNCIVKHSAKPAIPLYWLYFYRMLFGGLRRHPTYVTALDEVVQAILE